MNDPQIESDSRTPSGTSASSASIIETSYYSRGENDSVMPRDGIHRSTSRGIALERKENWRVGALRPRVTRVYRGPVTSSPLVDTALLPERDTGGVPSSWKRTQRVVQAWSRQLATIERQVRSLALSPAFSGKLEKDQANLARLGNFVAANRRNDRA